MCEYCFRIESAVQKIRHCTLYKMHLDYLSIFILLAINWCRCSALKNPTPKDRKEFYSSLWQTNFDSRYFKMQRNYVKELKNCMILSMRGMYPSVE